MRGASQLARRGLVGTAALGALTMASVAHAQTTSNRSVGVTLGEIVVTAQKREQNLQKTAVAVTALTSDRIQQANIAQPVQLQFRVPSMTFGYQSGYTYLTLRGVGNDTTVNAESSVATYLDGVYTGALISESVPSYDLARIEVLRGPQGTLYGRNTTGGVINYITRDPSFTPGGDVVKESIGAFPRMILAEGEYRAVARSDDREKPYERTFKVVTGVDTEVEVLAR